MRWCYNGRLFMNALRLSIISIISFSDSKPGQWIFSYAHKLLAIPLHYNFCAFCCCFHSWKQHFEFLLYCRFCSEAHPRWHTTFEYHYWIHMEVIGQVYPFRIKKIFDNIYPFTRQDLNQICGTGFTSYSMDWYTNLYETKRCNLWIQQLWFLSLECA